MNRQFSNRKLSVECFDDNAMLFSGAEVLTFRNHKIVNVSDFYCNPTASVRLPSATEKLQTYPWVSNSVSGSSVRS